jgi:exonuclease III
MGHVDCGIATFSKYNVTDSTRIQLPCPFSYPARLGNLKRCLMVDRVPIEDSDKELVLVNLHLEAYDSGEGKIAQTNMLKELLEEEANKGNYVIAGGDFNQKFPGSEAFPVISPDGWIPGQLDAAMLEDGWSFVYDDSKPTCRSLEAPYNDEKALAHEWQYYVIDGFIISPNVEKLSVNVIDLDFQNSDHNPVFMTFELK